MLLGYKMSPKIFGNKIKELSIPDNDIKDNILIFGNTPVGGVEFIHHIINEIIISKKRLIVMAKRFSIKDFIDLIQMLKFYKDKNHISRVYKIKLLISQNEQNDLIFPETHVLENQDIDIICILSGQSFSYKKNMDKINALWPNFTQLFYKTPFEDIPEKNTNTIVYTDDYQAVNPIFQKQFKTRIYMNMSIYDNFLPGIAPDLNIGEAYITSSNKNPDNLYPEYHLMKIIPHKYNDFKPKYKDIIIETYTLESFSKF